jgi:hypothetical protein
MLHRREFLQPMQTEFVTLVTSSSKLPRRVNCVEENLCTCDKKRQDDQLSTQTLHITSKSLHICKALLPGLVQPISTSPGAVKQMVGKWLYIYISWFGTLKQSSFEHSCFTIEYGATSFLRPHMTSPDFVLEEGRKQNGGCGARPRNRFPGCLYPPTLYIYIYIYISWSMQIREIFRSFRFSGFSGNFSVLNHFPATIRLPPSLRKELFNPEPWT